MHVYPEARELRTDQTKAITTFLLLSLLIHLALMFSLPSLSRPPHDTVLKKPIWIDVVDFSEPQASEPGSLSESAKMSTPPPQVMIPEQKMPGETIPSRKTTETAPSPASNSPAEIRQEQREVPPVEKLIPSMKNLLALQTSRDSPSQALHLGPQQDGKGNLPAETQYEKYLLALKRKVEKNWKVSLDPGIRQGTTTIYVIVAADGTLWSIDILKPSGMIIHDYEALEAVKRAFPLSPPPKNLLNEQSVLPIRFSFHYLLSPYP